MTSSPSERDAIEAESLTRYYGDRPAVDRVTFSVGRGEIFAHRLHQRAQRAGQ